MTNEMSMIRETPTGMINLFMRITSVSQNSLEELNNLNRWNKHGQQNIEEHVYIFYASSTEMKSRMKLTAAYNWISSH